ncbi:MAG: hypothetical protein Hyperionvirus39_15 [Hyperionvirus sp.]|uniref:Uncharacterized protein n=1 Tax=Hyperionvirus sp. TaxID=2487770 RepID=A0A3G5AC43_9VIRU|nr:MAG: hypothetical protein Hyperionvirus39_15 [Hyperionvirus sp.]
MYVEVICVSAVLGMHDLSLEHTFVYVLMIGTYEIRDDLCIDSPRAEKGICIQIN